MRSVGTAFLRVKDRKRDEHHRKPLAAATRQKQGEKKMAFTATASDAEPRPNIPKSCSQPQEILFTNALKRPCFQGFFAIETSE
jgi:hypothetical protein